MYSYLHYVVMLEGSPQFLSNLAQIGTPVPNWFSRVNYGPQGRPFIFPPGHDKAGQTEFVDIGSFKRMPPLREDNKMFVFNIYHDLEVDDAVTNPINIVKYPVEDGNLTQEQVHITVVHTSLVNFSSENCSRSVRKHLKSSNRLRKNVNIKKAIFG